MIYTPILPSERNQTGVLIHTIADQIQKNIQQNGNAKMGNPQAWKTDEKIAIKAEKENRNAGNAGRWRPNLPLGQDRFVAIASLTPYMNKWTIKGNSLSSFDYIYYYLL